LRRGSALRALTTTYEHHEVDPSYVVVSAKPNRNRAYEPHEVDSS
jgi:hypothetical protein